MRRLRTRDLRAVLGCAGELATIADPSAFPARVLPALRVLVPCDVVLYNEMEPGRQRSIAFGEPEEVIASLNPVWEGWMQERSPDAR